MLYSQLIRDSVSEGSISPHPRKDRLDLLRIRQFRSELISSERFYREFPSGERFSGELFFGNRLTHCPHGKGLLVRRHKSASIKVSGLVPLERFGQTYVWRNTNVRGPLLKNILAISSRPFSERTHWNGSKVPILKRSRSIQLGDWLMPAVFCNERTCVQLMRRVARVWKEFSFQHSFQFISVRIVPLPSLSPSLSAYRGFLSL